MDLSGGHTYGVLTIFFYLFFYIYVSYTNRKYSDFVKMKKFSDFRVYNRYMTNIPLLPEYPEPPSLSVKIFSETVCKDCESKPMVNTDNMGRDTSMYNQG
jgi:hypothetical protein